jgi:hypothetical protein
MTRDVQNAFDEGAKLPPEEQDRIGDWMLAELTDERAWEQRFRESPDTLRQLADEALDESQTTEPDPKKL